MNRAVVLVIAAVLMLFLVAGCGDKRPCLRSHEERYMTLIPVGKVMVPMWHTRTVCDQRANV